MAVVYERNSGELLVALQEVKSRQDVYDLLYPIAFDNNGAELLEHMAVRTDEELKDFIAEKVLQYIFSRCKLQRGDGDA